jgi:hypothetical protein
MIVRAVALVALAILGGAVGGAAGYALGTGDTETVTLTETTTLISATASGLPPAVEETRTALLEAAEAGSYEALRPLVPESGFEYTFGGPVDGGAIAFWQELERTTGEQPLEELAAVLQLPYVLSRGYYVFPWAYTVESVSDLSEHERALLAPLGELDTMFVPETGYLGWRAGIAPDGTWTFFVAGD